MVSRLAELGVVSIDAGIVVDDVKAIASMIEESANRAEIILIMGGVSVGQKDYVPEALSVLGAEIAFHGINMKPGMPAAFAVLNGTPVFALSGNPFAAAVTFELLVRPAIAIMASDERIAPKMHRAQLAADFTKKRPVNRFVRATLTEESVLIPEKQGNGQLRSMIGTNCIAELLAGDEPLLRGSSVNVYTMENNYYE
jgi:molybdopterin molybdotransferase